MLTDIHTHAFHPKIADKVLNQLQNHYGIDPVGLGTTDDLVMRIKTAGLERCVVHTAATSADQVIPANNWALDIQNKHEEIMAFGTVHPDFDDWETQMDRLEAGGIKGLKLHPDFQGFWLDDPRLGPIFEAASGRFAIMLHVGDKAAPKDNPSCPFKVMQVQRDFPDLTLIAAHMGGYLHWQWALEVLIGSGVYIDTSSAVPFMTKDQLTEIFKRHPRERILFGSDYPLFDPGQESRRLQQTAGLTDDEMHALYTNAGALFD